MIISTLNPPSLISVNAAHICVSVEHPPEHKNPTKVHTFNKERLSLPWQLPTASSSSGARPEYPLLPQHGHPKPAV